MAPSRGKAWRKKFFECNDHQGYTKNTCTEFQEKILNSCEVLDKHCLKWAQKYTPKYPQEGHDVEKNSAVTLKRNTKNVCTKFQRTYWSDLKK